MAITRFKGGQWDSATQKLLNPEIVTEYVGRVVRVFNKNYRAMSDVYTLATYAEVLGDDLQFHEVLVNANFECDIYGGRAEVDATPATLAIKTLRDIERANREEEAWRQREADRAERERNRPVKGKTMKVVKGRKVPVGTIGVVAYVKDDSVLLKDPANWQDRKANGQWVNASYLVAV